MDSVSDWHCRCLVLGDGIAMEVPEEVQQFMTGSDGPHLIYNDDCGNKFAANPYPLQASALRAYVATLAGSGVDVLCWCLGTGFVAFHDSEVYEVYGVGRTPLAGSGQWRQAANLAALIEAGDDPPAVICEACHQHGVQAFLSLRMNDCHHTDDDTGPLASRLWMAHPEYRLQRPERDYYSSAWDYSLPQVRQQRLGIICEAAEKYDTDGIELDFLRSPYLFNCDEAEDNQDILTDFLRQVRSRLEEIAAKKGQPVALAARCLLSVEDCQAAGMDVLTWMDEGLVSWLAPGGYYPDWARNLRELAAAGRQAQVGVFPTLNVAPQLGQYMTPQMYYGLAANYYQDGVDGMYIFNYPCFGEVYEPLNLDLLQVLGHPDEVQKKDKFFAVYHELPQQIPTDEVGRGTQTVAFRVADDIAAAHKKGTLKQATLSFKLINLTELDEAAVQINDKPVPASQLDRKLWPYGRDPRIHTVPLDSYYQYDVDLDGSLVQPGINSLTISLRKLNQESAAAVSIREIEISLEYH